VLLNDCTQDFEGQPVMTRPKLQGWISSLNGGCMVGCESQTWDSDAWWLPPVLDSDAVFYPGEMVEKLGYESYVFISAQGVTDLMNDLKSSFSIAAVYGEMMEAGAHVAMATISNDAIEVSEWCVSESDDRRCVEKGGDIGVPAPVPVDSPIMIFTLAAWRCLVDRMLVHRGGSKSTPRPALSGYSKNVACSPGGVLSLCNIGQSCISLDNSGSG